MNSSFLDLKLAARNLLRYPALTAVVVLTLALGIGANTAIFSVVRGVLLRPLPYPNADRVISIWDSNPERGRIRFGASLQNLEDWRASSRTVSEMAAWWTGQGNLSGGDRPERITYGLVSPELFAVLGAAPALGRTFRPEENLPGNDNGVIVSHSFWQTALGGREDVLGATLQLDERPLEIIGVMPRGFTFPEAGVDLWKTLGGRPDDFGSRGAHWAAAVGLLAPGRTLAEAQTELKAIAARLEAAYPETNTGWTVYLEPFHASVVQDVRPVLLILWVAVSLVLLIACANVANVLLARATRREQEIAVRTALGAGRFRLIRQLLIESLLFSAAGGILGLALGRGGLTLVARFVPANLPRVEAIALDGLVLAYSAGLVLLAGVFFGAFPAIRATGTDMGGSLRQGGRGTLGPGHHRLRGAFVIAELALAAVVLVGAGLVTRSLIHLLNVDPGFASENRLALRVAPSRAALPEREAAVAFYDRLLERLAALPGAASASAINVLPVSGSWWNASAWIEGRANLPEERPSFAVRVVQGDYLGTIGIPLLSGRALRGSDDANGEPVIVIDETAARRVWPGEDPIGQRLSFSDAAPERRWYTVVGVAGPVRHNALELAPTPMAYITTAQAQFGHFRDWGMSLVIETNGDPSSLIRPARSVVEELDPNLPVYQVRTLARLVEQNVASRRFTMNLLLVFGIVALVLASVGVYGVLSYSVAERTTEIGMRIALGAQPGRILAWVTVRGMALAASGLAIGLTLAAAVSRSISTLLYDIGGFDVLTYGGIAILLSGVALVACLVPALRATRIDPLVALRDG